MDNHEITILIQQNDEPNAAANNDNYPKLADTGGSALEKITGLKVYSLEEIESATDNFSPSRMLGEGSSGQVFHGLLCDKHVAVKRLRQSERVEQADNRMHLSELDEEKVKEEFMREIHLMGIVNHKNILSPIGFCLDSSTPLLVTEKLQSLHDALYDKDRKPLDWNTRFQIALGVAKGLAYLHTGARKPLLHCDIKPGNILLDPEKLEHSYIADFGVVHLLAPDQSAIAASWYYGTPGYWAPEVRAEKRLSAKSDVYSFGKLLYALVTGKDDVHEMPASLIRKSEPRRGVRKHLRHCGIGCVFLFLPWIRLRSNIIEATLESVLMDEVWGSARALMEAYTILRLVVLCTQHNAEQRPSMERVTLELESATSCQISWIARTAISVGIQRLRWVWGIVMFIFVAIFLFLFTVTMLIVQFNIRYSNLDPPRHTSPSTTIEPPHRPNLFPLMVLDLVAALAMPVFLVVSYKLRKIVGLLYWIGDEDLMFRWKPLDRLK